MRAAIAWLLCTTAMISGCAPGRVWPREASTAVSSTSDPSPVGVEERLKEMPRPFLFREAKLPAQYPPPGPVGKVVVKSYPPSRMAMVHSRDLDDAGQNRMFMSLFNHIKREKIAMTAPVVMEYSVDGDAARADSMAFVYADTSIGATGDNGDVTVFDVPSITVVSVGVRGSYGEKHLKDALRLIDGWLADRPDEYVRAGAPRYLGYNSPMVPWFLRYGEVQLPVRSTR
jgi:hypothetical protein